MLPELFSRVRQYGEAESQQAKARLCLMPITAAHCEAFAAHLQCEDAQRSARLATQRPNAERLPILAAAFRTERANPVNTVKPKPSRNAATKRAIVLKHTASESLKRAARAFATHPQRTSEVMLAIRELAHEHGLQVPKSRLRAASDHADPQDVSLYLLGFAFTPNAASLKTAIDSLARYGLTVMSQHDAQPARLLTPGVHAPEPPTGKVHRIPTGALDWVTNGAPKEPHAYAEQVQEADARHAEVESRAPKARRYKLIEHTKRVNAVNTKSPKWNARMGKEVLRLKK